MRPARRSLAPFVVTVAATSLLVGSGCSQPTRNPPHLETGNPPGVETPQPEASAVAPPAESAPAGTTEPGK